MFHNAFKNKTEERETSRYIISNDFEPELVEQMLRYCYTGEVQDLPKIDLELLVVADYFVMPLLTELCINSIRETMSKEKLPKLCEILTRLTGKDIKQSLIDLQITGYPELRRFSDEFLYKTTESITRRFRRSNRLQRMFEAFDTGRGCMTWC